MNFKMICGLLTVNMGIIKVKENEKTIILLFRNKTEMPYLISSDVF